MHFKSEKRNEIIKKCFEKKCFFFSLFPTFFLFFFLYVMMGCDNYFFFSAKSLCLVSFLSDKINCAFDLLYEFCGFVLKDAFQGSGR